mgnify:CR=1 FL=1
MEEVKKTTDGIIKNDPEVEEKYNDRYMRIRLEENIRTKKRHFILKCLFFIK